MWQLEIHLTRELQIRILQKVKQKIRRIYLNLISCLDIPLNKICNLMLALNF